MNDIKMIVVDMDGTFLRDDNTYDVARFNRQFEQLADQGIRFVAASGSQLQRLQNQFDQVRDRMDFISENGSVVYSNDEIVYSAGLTSELLQQIQAMIKEHFWLPKASTTITGLKSAYIDQIEPQELFDLKERYYNQLQRVASILTLTAEEVDDTLIKVGISFPGDDSTAEQMQLVKKLLPDGLESLNSGFNTELIGLAGVNKRSGITKLMEKYKISADQIMTFGDNENDLSMLQMTSHGYAMGNAGEQIKNAAGNLAPDNNHDGVLQVIDLLLGN